MAPVRLALLTAQRADKVASMKWSEISPAGEWRIATEEREKGNAGLLVLPVAALAIIRAQPRMVNNPYVFPGRAKGHFNGFSPGKRAMDAAILVALREAAIKRGEDPDKVTPLAHWQFHDLRRTARSLMSRAGVRSEIAERTLGHDIAGVEGVYDRHEYRDEKADAVHKLAGLLEMILSPPADNVVKMPATA